MKLEQMNDFFAARVEGYDEHMRTTIEGADDFYAYTASLLPAEKDACVLDLGCGTGLELEEYFRLNPDAAVTGIDLSDAMLNALKAKFPDRKLNLVQGSYFDVPFGENAYSAAVSVESLHHFTAEKKEGLYARLHAALKKNGFFVLTDYYWRAAGKRLISTTSSRRITSSGDCWRTLTGSGPCLTAVPEADASPSCWQSRAAR